MVTERAGLCITKAQSYTWVYTHTVCLLHTLGVISSCSTVQCNCSLQHCGTQADNACSTSPCVRAVKCTNTLMTEEAQCCSMLPDCQLWLLKQLMRFQLTGGVSRVISRNGWQSWPTASLWLVADVAVIKSAVSLCWSGDRAKTTHSITVNELLGQHVWLLESSNATIRSICRACRQLSLQHPSELATCCKCWSVELCRWVS